MAPKILIVEIRRTDGVVSGKILDKMEAGQIYKVWEVRDEKGTLTIVFVKRVVSDE